MTTTAVAVYLGKKGTDYLLKQFGKSVVEKCTQKRATHFLEAFVEAVGKGEDEKSIASKLDDIFGSEANEEVLFEAHRLVCLSKSKDIGPRAIALLTAQLVLEGRTARPVEEQWFEVYETFSEWELKRTSEFYQLSFKHARNGNEGYTIEDGVLKVAFATEETPTGVAIGFPRETEIDRSPLDYHQVFGAWARKLSGLGLIRVRAKEIVRNYSQMGNITNSDESTRILKQWTELQVFDEQYAAIIGKAHRMVCPEGES